MTTRTTRIKAEQRAFTLAASGWHSHVDSIAAQLEKEGLGQAFRQIGGPFLRRMLNVACSEAAADTPCEVPARRKAKGASTEAR